METRQRDPLGVHAAMPFAGRFHPLGFPLEIATNSPDVLAAARESWGDRPVEFDTAPLAIRVLVDAEEPLCDAPTHRKHGHLYAIVSDAQNFAHIDLDAQFAFAQVSRRTAADHAWFRWFFLDALAYIMLSQRHVVMAHAGCVAREGGGLLLCGPSGAGKSTLSYAAARAGWTWVADDCVCLLSDSPGRIALGRSWRARFRPDAPKLFPELGLFAERARPTGKIGIEVDMGAMPGCSVALRAPVRALTFLDRRPGRAAVNAMSGEEAVERMIRDLPSYGGETDLLHERTIGRLASAPAYRLIYETIEDGVRLLSNL